VERELGSDVDQRRHDASKLGEGRLALSKRALDRGPGLSERLLLDCSSKLGLIAEVAVQR
jgi:hypothetical protein